ncbi:type I secretion system permease/ATPase [Ensifer sp. ENS04]|uniref:type I secretion system permease/ATPase n=1 Tax=Ensifer sp. ENS04 TaxID=2769281 RepID=UPI001782C246|nr:type I secretion system permease/ATPase [Ensifer sp. ENS04]MBD9538957.1 type I secretion system permease/ATPase [Ensifer sp. ENS04]
MDTGILCLVMVAHYLRVPADPEVVRHDLGLVANVAATTDILRAAKRLKLRARQSMFANERLDRIALPAIIETRAGGFAVLAAVGDAKILIRDPTEHSVREMSRSDFEAFWTGRVILVTSRAFSEGFLRRFDFSWFVPEILRYRWILLEVLAASFVVQVLGLVSPIFFQLVIDKVLVNNGLSTLEVLAIGLSVVSLFEVMLTALRTYTTNHTTNRIDVALGAKLFHHLMGLPISYFESRQAGQTVARVHELETIRAFLTGSALTVVLDVFFLFVFLAVMYLYSPWLTLIVIASMPTYVALSVMVTPVFRRRLEEKFNRGAANQTFLVEAIVGVETLKAMAVEPQMQRRWEDQLAGYVEASFKTANLGNVANSCAQFISKAVSVLTIWFGAKAVLSGDLTVGQLVAFSILSGRVSGPVLRLAQLWQDFQQIKISVDRLGDILNAPVEVMGGPGQGSLKTVRGKVSFDHVTFRYRPGDREILSDVSFEIAAGEVVGVVGPSGSGKSTVAKLLQRLYVPEKGRVLVDGADVSLIDPRSLRRQIGVVLQESILFRRTVRENIALADPGLPLERVIEAAKLAGAHEFILQLPSGYDTVLEERGSNLSGGQRQRVAIARALVTNPRVLIFDEATSALDYESEYVIQQNMRRIAKGRTVFIIAHRLAALRDATRIITLEAGRLTEQGSHNELLKLGGRYAQLYRLQGTMVP